MRAAGGSQSRDLTGKAMRETSGLQPNPRSSATCTNRVCIFVQNRSDFSSVTLASLGSGILATEA
jgi:hypothetical protein